MADSRRRDSRSRSPARKPRGTGGFRWKDRRPRDADAPDNRERRDRGLERGYRNRSPRRDYDHRNRDRSSDRDQDRDGDRDGYRSRRDRDSGYGRDRDGDRDRDGEGDRERPRRDEDRNRDRDRDRDRDGNGGNFARATPASSRKDRDRDSTSKKEKKPAAPAPKGGAGEEMIIVTVNDRLGSKTQVPCLGSDTIGQLKVMVAMRIGREPHEILLKRQGERPFKNQITVADYGISNGVQLDLEVDTGD